VSTINNQFGVTIGFKVFYPICWVSWRPISKALYLATLLEQDSVNKKARGRMWLCGETNATSTLTTILPLRPILNASSKNICQTSSSEVMLSSMTSSEMCSCNFKVFETGWAARKSARAWPFIAFCGTKVMLYWDNNIAQLASLEFKDPSFVIKICKGLTLELTCMVWPTKEWQVFWIVKTRARYSFSTGL